MNVTEAIVHFRTKSERDLWVRWYQREGNKYFSSWMLNSGKKWREQVQKRLDDWPNRNELLSAKGFKK